MSPTPGAWPDTGLATVGTLVGFGDHSSEVAAAEDVLRQLLEATATLELDIDGTLSTAIAIASEHEGHGKPTTSGA